MLEAQLENAQRVSPQSGQLQILLTSSTTPASPMLPLTLCFGCNDMCDGSHGYWFAPQSGDEMRHRMLRDRMLRNPGIRPVLFCFDGGWQLQRPRAHISWWTFEKQEAHAAPRRPWCGCPSACWQLVRISFHTLRKRSESLTIFHTPSTFVNAKFCVKAFKTCPSYLTVPPAATRVVSFPPVNWDRTGWASSQSTTWKQPGRSCDTKNSNELIIQSFLTNGLEQVLSQSTSRDSNQ